MRLLLLLPLLACGSMPDPLSPDGGTAPASIGPEWFATEVVSVTYGDHAGFGQQSFPGIVLGPPQGGGTSRGSLDVLSLGFHGSITLKMGRDVVDGPGADFIVFENAFVNTGGPVWAEPGLVEASPDGQAWSAFPCDSATFPYPGCAGTSPTLAPGPDGGIDPRDPTVAGGNPFDLASVGLSRARFIRITDVSTDDTGGTTAGFDLDAVAVVRHASP